MGLDAKTCQLHITFIVSLGGQCVLNEEGGRFAATWPAGLLAVQAL